MYGRPVLGQVQQLNRLWPTALITRLVPPTSALHLDRICLNGRKAGYLCRHLFISLCRGPVEQGRHLACTVLARRLHRSICELHGGPPPRGYRSCSDK